MARVRQQSVEQARTLRVAAAQIIFAATIEENLDRIEQLAEQAVRKRADAVLFPEFAVTGYACDFSSLKPAQIHDVLQAVGAVAARLRTNLLIGSPVFRRRQVIQLSGVVQSRRAYQLLLRQESFDSCG